MAVQIFNVYKIQNKISLMVYVGITTQSVTTKFYEHVNSKVKSKINDSLKLENLDIFEFSNLYKAENYEESLMKYNEYVNEYDSINSGYNSKSGPDTAIDTDTQKNKKLSEAISGDKNPQYGKLGEANPKFGKKSKEGTGENISQAKIKNGILRKEGLLDPRKERPKGYIPDEAAVKAMQDSKRPKYINVKIQDPIGKIHLLEGKEELRNFLETNSLNNFMNIIISGKRNNVKGYILVSYELNPEYNGNK